MYASDSRRADATPVDLKSDAAGSHVVESSSSLMVYKVSEILAIMQTQLASMSQQGDSVSNDMCCHNPGERRRQE